MNKKEWQKISEAGKLLGLREEATLAEIKEAYRRKAKKNHPDLVNGEGRQQNRSMQEITAAYQTLLAYCTNYSFPLVRPENDEEVDPEDWWMDRFGQDPLWGRDRE